MAEPQILCQLYDHAKQYDNECSSHVYVGDGSCMAIYLAMVMEMPRQVGMVAVFEEVIKRLMCDRVYHITGFGCTSEVCTNSRGEKGQCTVAKRLANCGKVRVRTIHGLSLAVKNSHTYCKIY